MKRKWVIVCCLLYTLAASFYRTYGPKGTDYVLPPLPPAENWLLLPLDGRPPCKDFTVQLGALGGTTFTVPPDALMDHYEKPANIPALKTWVQANLPRQKGILLSTDLLLFGGLLQSRLQPLENKQADTFFTYLETLKNSNPDKQFYLFSVIPRLLITDHLLPDRWYQWQLMTWATNMDKKRQGLPYDKEQYEDAQQSIPMALKWKYLNLYWKNDDFNKALITFVTQNNLTDLTIGQDDAQPYGLPNYNRHHAVEMVRDLMAHPPIAVSQGADELGSLAASRIFCRRIHYQPQVKICYGSPEMADYTLHFVPQTLKEIAKDKVQLAGGVLTESLDTADFILYIYCGTKDTNRAAAACREIKALMDKKPVALVDLSDRFAAGDCLLPYLAAHNVPLPRLVSYSGWNTASNAIGTAVAQGTIVTGQAKVLPKALLPSLYGKNFQFTYARFLDDWAYQKLIRPRMGILTPINGMEPEQGVPYVDAATSYTARELGLYNWIFLCLCRKFPYYQDGDYAYYLKDVDFHVTLPWGRPFEIRLEVLPKYSRKPLTKQA